MIRSLACIAAFCIAMPASAAGEAAEPAAARLNGCLLAGSSGAPRTNLREAVISVRSFCAPQIKRVRTQRVEAATKGLSEEAGKAAEDQAIRALNDEIALAIANFTGLTL
ncbi:hypothetical protein [Pontixanthobacter sp.]|uniref:hypothetical protein n=1 Tax=Pontixanthobacter sp. TaxID=2792078 RepID=UPI003C7E43CE